jgi:hypothetical protein
VVNSDEEEEEEAEAILKFEEEEEEYASPTAVREREHRADETHGHGAGAGDAKEKDEKEKYGFDGAAKEDELAEFLIDENGGGGGGCLSRTQIAASRAGTVDGNSSNEFDHASTESSALDSKLWKKVSSV